MGTQANRTPTAESRFGRIVSKQHSSDKLIGSFTIHVTDTAVPTVVMSLVLDKPKYDKFAQAADALTQLQVKPHPSVLNLLQVSQQSQPNAFELFFEAGVNCQSMVKAESDLWELIAQLSALMSHLESLRLFYPCLSVSYLSFDASCGLYRIVNPFCFAGFADDVLKVAASFSTKQKITAPRLELNLRQFAAMVFCIVGKLPEEVFLADNSKMATLLHVLRQSKTYSNQLINFLQAISGAPGSFTFQSLQSLIPAQYKNDLESKYKVLESAQKNWLNRLTQPANKLFPGAHPQASHLYKSHLYHSVDLSAHRSTWHPPSATSLEAASPTAYQNLASVSPARNHGQSFFGTALDQQNSASKSPSSAKHGNESPSFTALAWPLQRPTTATPVSLGAANQQSSNGQNPRRPLVVPVDQSLQSSFFSSTSFVNSSPFKQQSPTPTATAARNLLVVNESTSFFREQQSSSQQDQSISPIKVGNLLPNPVAGSGIFSFKSPGKIPSEAPSKTQFDFKAQEANPNSTTNLISREWRSNEHQSEATPSKQKTDGRPVVPTIDLSQTDLNRSLVVRSTNLSDRPVISASSDAAAALQPKTGSRQPDPSRLLVVWYVDSTLRKYDFYLTPKGTKYDKLAAIVDSRNPLKPSMYHSTGGPTVWQSSVRIPEPRA